MSRLLILPDVHRNLNFVKSVLKKETSFDTLVSLGDWFDSKYDNVAGTGETCKFMLHLDRELGNKIVWCLGNHDAPMFWAYPYAKKFKYKIYENPFICSGHTEKSAIKFAKVMTEELMDKFVMAAYIDGILFSHAGVHPSFILPYSKGKTNIDYFIKKANDTLKHFRQESYSPLFGAGPVRGGKDAVGGPLWLDWNEEFEEIIDVPQIVGHTRGKAPRHIGRSWNLDCEQNWYAIINNGIIEFKVADEERWEAEKGEKYKHIRGHFKTNI